MTEEKSKDKKKVPEVRFKGFSGEWEEDKLENLCSIITKQTGFDYSATIKPSLLTEKKEETYSFIQNKDFDGLKINLNTDFYIPIKVAENFQKILLNTPSLLISISGKIGNVGLYNKQEKAFIGGAVGVCKLKNKNNAYVLLYYLLSNVGQDYFNSLIKASSHANITVEDIRNFLVKIPINENEQSKIGTFFSNLDNLITLQQRKYEKLQKVKKSLLEKMFPKEGAKVPQIRFKGFSGEWEEKKLGEICLLITKGTTPKDKSGNGTVNFIKVENINSDNGEITSMSKITIEEHENYLKRSRLKENDILFSIAGTLGRVSIVKSNILPANTNQALAILRVNEGFIPYLTTVLKGPVVESFIRKNPTIGAQPNLSLEQVNNLEISYPKFEEQSKIGTFFFNLDNLITLQQRKLEKLKKVKKAMLEKMFV